MIIQAIIVFIMKIGNALIGVFPSIPATLPDGIASAVGSVFQGVGYVLPLGVLAPIWIISLALDLAKISWAVILRAKSFVPFWGN